MTVGMVLGKFLPPHAGHLHLVQAAAAQVDRLYVLVGTLAREPIPGALRHAWMRALCPSNAVVVHVTDENPQEPHEHPDFWEMWTGTVRRACPEPLDVVFSSEDYGDELARRLGARHMCVDRGRATVPVSGTAIRRRPAGCWDHIPPLIRPWFVKRVVLTGAESTGKTTMAARLAAHYGTTWIPEFARGHIALRGNSFGVEDMVPIAEGQAALEAEATLRARRVLICDTDAAVTGVYSEQYFGVVPPRVQALADARPADLHLLFHPDVPWVADPQRDMATLRPRMHERFRASLEGRGLSWTDVRGTWDERFAACTGAIDALLEEPMRPFTEDGALFPGW